MAVKLGRFGLFGGPEVTRQELLDKWNRAKKQMDHLEMPQDHQDKDAASSHDIDLTSASSATETRASDYHNDVRKPRSAFSTFVKFCAVFFTFAWPGTLLAFLTGLMGWNELIALGPQWWVAIAAVAIFPLPAFWLVALTWVRARDLGEQARYLARVANRLVEPDQTAAREIATVGMAVRREVEGLATGVEAALEKVRTLEGVVAKQAIAIEDAALEAENRTGEVRRRMEKERDQLTQLADDLTARTDVYSETISKHGEWVRNVSEEAYTKFDQAAETLDKQSRTMSSAISAAVTNSQEAGLELDRQSSKLETISDAALSRADVIASRYDHQRAAIAEATEKLNQENTRLEGVMENQREVLAQISGIISDQSEAMQASIGTCATSLQTALDKAVERAGSAAEQFQEEVDAVTANSEQAMESIVTAAERAGQMAELARNALDAESTSARKAVEQQAAYAKEMVNGLFHSFESAYQAKATRLDTAFGKQSEDFKTRIDMASEAARTALSDQASEAYELVSQTTAAVETASDRLGTMLDKLQATSELSSEAFSHTAQALDQHLTSLPTKTEAAAAQISRIMDEELNAFSRLADEAGRKVQKLVAAYGRHLPGVRPQYGASTEMPSPYRAAGYSRQDFEQDPARGTLAPGTKAEDGTKSDWGWGELLASIDKPTNRNVPQVPNQSLDQLQNLTEEDLSSSALKVFESLQSMAIDIDRALEADPPADLLRRYFNGERALFTKRIIEMTSADLARKIHDRYLGDQAFRDNVNLYIEQFESLLNNAVARDQEDILIETFLSSHTGKAYLLLGSAVGHFG